MIKKYFFSIFTIFCFMGVPISYSDTLCPDPQIESSVVPSDLARVQEDIDRLSLCVERTKLLQDLNKLSNESKTGVQPLGVGAIDTSLLQPVTAKTLNKNSSKNKALKQQKPFEAKSSWEIRRVWGQGGKLQAQLISSDGVLVTAKIGESLTDGSTVKEISVRGVKVTRKNGREDTLGWQQESKDESL